MKPMVRLGGADLTAGSVSAIIRREVYSTFVLRNAAHPKFNAGDRTKGDKSIPISVLVYLAKVRSSVVRNASRDQFAVA
jgi:hypothetical protein